MLSFFPRDVLDEILNLIESVSEGFPSYSFMLSLSEDTQSDVIQAFNSTSRYLDDLLNNDNNFFNSMVNCIIPSELHLNRANVSDTDASFLDLHLFTMYIGCFVKIKIYDKRDDFDIVNFSFLDGDVPRSTSYGVYISQLIRFARVSSPRDSDGYARIDVRFPDKNDKLVQTR